MKTLSLISLFFVTTLIPFTTGGTTTTISVSGEILPETCDITTGSLNQDIDLGEYSVTDFPSSGSVTKMVPFSLEMKNCTTGISAANIRFSGNSLNSTIFAMQGGGADIGLELLDAAGLTMSPGLLKRFTLTGGDNTLSFSMRLKSVKSSVTAGDLRATIFMDIEYE